MAVLCLFEELVHNFFIMKKHIFFKATFIMAILFVSCQKEKETLVVKPPYLAQTALDVESLPAASSSDAYNCNCELSYWSGNIFNSTTSSAANIEICGKISGGINPTSCDYSMLCGNISGNARAFVLSPGNPTINFSAASLGKFLVKKTSPYFIFNQSIEAPTYLALICGTATNHTPRTIFVLSSGEVKEFSLRSDCYQLPFECE